jgi:hypothetical protein
MIGSCLVCTLFSSTGHIMACHAVTCSQVHSRRCNRSWHSRSPSDRTYRVDPSCHLHPDTEQKQHSPVPPVLQGNVEFGAGPLKERGRGDEEDKLDVHPHLLVVAPERPAVDKLLAKKSPCGRLVPDIKAAEDLNLGPIASPATILVAHSRLHAPHQPSDQTLTKLVVLTVRLR